MDLAFGHLTAVDYAVLAVAVLLGGFVKGVVGLGLPMIAIPIISTVMDPRSAIAVMTLPILGSNFLQAQSGGSMVETALRFRGFLVPMTLGAIVGAAIITQVHVDHAELILGTLVALFATTTLAGWQPVLSARVDRRLRPAVGLVSGVIGGMSSFFAPTVTPYLFTLGLDKNTFIRAMGVAFLIGELPLMLGLIAAGFAPLPVWVLSAAGWALVAGAMHLGAKLRDRVPQKGFKTIVGVTLLVVGLNMIRRAVL